MAEFLEEIKRLATLINQAERNKLQSPIGYPHATHVASFVLASGREVEMPVPDPEIWEEVPLSDEEKASFAEIVPASAAWHNSKIYGDFTAGKTTYVVGHPEGVCWLMDMARFVCAEEKVDAFTTKFAYVTKVRKFREHIIDAEFDDRPYPTLREYLW